MKSLQSEITASSKVQKDNAATHKSSRHCCCLIDGLVSWASGRFPICHCYHVCCCSHRNAGSPRGIPGQTHHGTLACIGPCFHRTARCNRQFRFSRNANAAGCNSDHVVRRKHRCSVRFYNPVREQFGRRRYSRDRLGNGRSDNDPAHNRPDIVPVLWCLRSMQLPTA